MLGNPTIISPASVGDEVAQVGDNTILVLPLSQPLTKQGVELAQAEHFQREVAENPNWAFDILLARDRPDFWIQRGTTRLGLDVAAFASTERRRAADQFRRLKRILMAEYRRGRLRQCEGVEVQLFFSEERLPKPEKFEKSITEFVVALEGYRVDHAAWARVDGVSFITGANPYPLGEAGTTTDGTMNWHVSGLNRSESVFSRSCGFNVEHQFVEMTSATKVAAELQRIIGAHDIAGQGINELVLVAGGPDIFGEAVGGESTISELYFDKWNGTIPAPKHLNRIFVDNWLLGRARLIFDRKTEFIINSQLTRHSTRTPQKRGAG